MTRTEANDDLHQYVVRHCPSCYAKILLDGSVILSGDFLYKDLVHVMRILDEYFEED